MPSVKDNTNDLAARIRQAKPGSEPFRERLQTSERVIRRVTDGIYREPWAAIRELISNAYDADATQVTVTTDAPRFSQITVRDNGNGFTAESLASMCTNIGGSPKRTAHGANLGVTSADDPNLSPSGRRLIGKLGIGLFAVSQLSQQFRIITKVKGERERTVADVVLFRYSEQKKSGISQSDEIETAGEIQITKIDAEDLDAQGTDIIIETLLPRTRDEFRSRDTWELIQHPPTEEEGGGSVARPQYHIGFTSSIRPDTFDIKPSLPWNDKDEPDERFQKLTEAMFKLGDQPGSDRRASLKTTFDNYLRFIWLIALSIPGEYLERHPFDLDKTSGVRFFKLGKMKTGRAEEVLPMNGQTIRQELNLKAPDRGGMPEFNVMLDGLELRRPLRFTGLPTSNHAVTTPLLFVGTDTPNMSKFSERVTGGPLSFEGYLLWSPRVIPIEHNGVLVRIGDASGALFDETFMRYQISEQTRKEQVSAEIFVLEGMDAALNIDRESFNHSHPHYQYIAAWVHDAFKQLATKHKSVGSEIRKNILAQNRATSQKHLERVIEDAVSEWSDGDESPVPVEFAKNDLLLRVEPKKNVLVITEEALQAALPPGQKLTARRSDALKENEQKLAAIAQLLYSAGVLDQLTPEKQQKLFVDLAKIIFFRVTND